MRAALLSVGSEILAGQLVDTNSQFFAQELTQLGVPVERITQVPDGRAEIAEAIRESLAVADLIVLTGGLGPTVDDLTREAIADVAGESPETDPAMLENIARVFRSRGQAMPERNAKQAWIIPSSEFIENNNGTAPGWFVSLPEATVVALPGPPRENRRMWHGPVLERLTEPLDAQVIVSQTVKTIGIGESSVEDAIEDLVNRSDPVTATYAKSDGVHIRVTATGEQYDQAKALVDATVDEIRRRIGRFIYGTDQDSLAAAVTRPIRRAGGSLAVHEIGTAGTIGNLLLRDPGASTSVTSVQIEPAGRIDDASEAATQRIATALIDYVQSDWGLAVVATLEHENAGRRTNGTVCIALAGPGGVHSQLRTIQAFPDEIRRRAMLWTAEFLWFESAVAVVKQAESVSNSSLAP